MKMESLQSQTRPPASWPKVCTSKSDKCPMTPLIALANRPTHLVHLDVYSSKCPSLEQTVLGEKHSWQKFVIKIGHEWPVVYNFVKSSTKELLLFLAQLLFPDCNSPEHRFFDMIIPNYKIKLQDALLEKNPDQLYLNSQTFILPLVCSLSYEVLGK